MTPSLFLTAIRRLFSPQTLEQRDERLVHRLRASGVTIGQDCRIYSKSFSTEPYLVTIEDDVAIAGGVRFLTHNGAARLRRKARPEIQSFGRIVIGAHSFIGEGVIVLPGTQLGRCCVVLAGAVIHGSIPDNSLVAGNPAQVVGRASLYLDRLENGPNTLDTFSLTYDERRRRLEHHFNIAGPS